MANENKNINELVSEDNDPTAELEALIELRREAAEDEPKSESSARTFGYNKSESQDASIDDLKSDLESRSETINRLQFDIEQFRTRWNGLEAEIRARQEIADNLNREIEETREKLKRSEASIAERDEAIGELEAAVRQREQSNSDLQAAMEELAARHEKLHEELEQSRGAEALRQQQVIDRQAGRLASNDAEIGKLRAQIERTETYADSIRRQLQERADDFVASAEVRGSLERDLDAARQQVLDLNSELGSAHAANAALQDKVDELHRLHAEEIRTIRFELGEAQETVAEQERVAEQLATDLVGARNDRSELENQLGEAASASQSRIDALEKEVTRLRKAHQESDEKLASKSEAINCLLAELAKKTQRMESIVEIEEVIDDIDDRVSTQVGKRAAPDRDRVTRLLIGSVEGQELRFPLFKNRLTIGRTEQNDIQLKANYVSRRHAVVVTDREMTRVIDWGSKNGVFVNGVRVTEHFLRNGDTVTIGTADFVYEERPKRDA